MVATIGLGMLLTTICITPRGIGCWSRVLGVYACLIPVEKRILGAVQLHIKNYRDFVEDVIAGGFDHANFRSEAATIFLSTQQCKRAPFSPS